MKTSIAATLGILPQKPGVYKFIAAQGEVLYVGKAKNLKNRVSSYFNKTKTGSLKLRVLVRRTESISYTIVDTESDALLLENNLIKHLKPRYNILLKDDKTYPWVCIKNEPFPRVFVTRKVLNDGSQYFGPFTSGVFLKSLLDLIKQLYPLRTCSLNLTEKNIREKKFKACLEFQLGNCLAPCIANQTNEEYLANINSIKNLLNGNNKQEISELQTQMKRLAKQLKFEEAQVVKQKIEILNKYQSKTAIVNPRMKDTDVFSIQNDGANICVNYIKVQNGSIVQTHNVEIKQELDETSGEALGMAVADIRQRFQSKAPEVIVSELPDFQLANCKYVVPLRGEKLQLLGLSKRNGKEFLMAVRNRKEKQVAASSSQRILSTMKADLRLASLPQHIECFDNSNLQGTDPVAACVVFKNAKPVKSEYRHFNIKTVEGPDDYASMREVIFRRYSRALDEQSPIPQLVIVDGGKGQVAAAYQALENLDLSRTIQIVGIAEKLEELYFPGDPIPLHLDKRSETLKVIQHARNEAHRFGLAFHRNKRAKSVLKSQLTDIKGVGEKTMIKLFQKYPSLDAVKAASHSELQEIVGARMAQIIKQHLS